MLLKNPTTKIILQTKMGVPDFLKRGTLKNELNRALFHPKSTENAFTKVNVGLNVLSIK